MENKNKTTKNRYDKQMPQNYNNENDQETKQNKQKIS